MLYFVWINKFHKAAFNLFETKKKKKNTFLFIIITFFVLYEKKIKKFTYFLIFRFNINIYQNKLVIFFKKSQIAKKCFKFTPMLVQ